VLTPFLEARAWRIATQLVRRAPNRLTLLESAFNGHYIFHSVVPRDATGPLEAYRNRLVDVNRHGTMLDKPGHSLSPALDSEARQATLLFDPAPQLYRKLSAEFALPDPRPLPRSTPEVLSFRFIVAWLQIHVALGCSYACWQGVDTDGSVRVRFFEAFPVPEIANLSTPQNVDMNRWHPQYRTWFLVEGDGPPAACIDSKGVLHTLDGTRFDIGAIYREAGRSMWPPVAAVRGQVEHSD